MSKSLQWALAPSPSHPLAPWRRRALRALRCAGVSLARYARRWNSTRMQAEAAELLLEFHAEAGAPEGALFVDGRRVGTLPGITRL
jgi:hypothetical protein